MLIPRVFPAPSVLLLILGSTALLTACQKPVLYKGSWPWMPSEVEIHGLSRFIISEDEELLSLRVQFLDPDGDPAKFPGQVRFTIDPESAPDSEERRFSFDLSDLKINEEHWDRVTSNYRFKLDPQWEAPPLPSSPILVRVVATLDNGPELRTAITLRRSG